MGKFNDDVIKWKQFSRYWPFVRGIHRSYMHICITKQTLIGPDICLSPDQRQAVIYTNAGILLIGPLGTNFSEILSEIHTLSCKKTHFKMSFGKWRPFFFRGISVLNRKHDTQMNPLSSATLN